MERRRRSCGQGRGVDEDGAGGGREGKIDAERQRRREEIENKAGEEDQAAKTETSHSIKTAEGQRGRRGGRRGFERRPFQPGAPCRVPPGHGSQGPPGFLGPGRAPASSRAVSSRRAAAAAPMGPGAPPPSHSSASQTSSSNAEQAAWSPTSAASAG